MPVYPGALRIARNASTEVAVKKSVLRIRRQQEDLPNAALLPYHMCFGRIAQRHPATNRQNELSIAHVIGKLAHLGWIRLRKHARNLHCRILRRCALRQSSSVAKGAALLYLRDQLRANLTAYGVGDCIHQSKFLNRLIVINRQHVRDPKGAGVIQLIDQPASLTAPGK